MLFIHQAPRGFTEQRPGSVTPTRPVQGDRVNSRGRRSAGGPTNSGPKRPSSAVGNHATGSETPNRRTHGSERVGSNSRPGSANIIGRFGLRKHTPPVSARSSGPVANGANLGTSGSSVGTSGGSSGNSNGAEQRNGAVSPAAMPSTRPVTPMGRYQLGQVRSSTPGPVRVPSVGPTALPLHVANIGPSPQLQQQQQRPRSPSTGSTGSSQQKRPPQSNSPGNSNREIKASESSSTSAPPSRPESAQTSSGSSQRDVNGNNLTTVISSALDYKRFLDRRKQMIQQQVESAQQAPEPGQSSEGNGNGANGRDPATSGNEAPSETVTNAFGNAVTTGWMPGTTGPVKASHTVTPSLGTEQTSDAKSDAKSQATRQRLSTGSTAVANSSTTTPGANTSEEGSKDETGEDSSGLNSARRTPSATAGATQHLLRRLQDQQIRAQTPTRYTQSSGNVSGGDSGDLRRNSLPAGGGRQACRSLGQSGEQRWVDRDQQSAALDRANTCPNTAVLEAQTANLDGTCDSGDGTGRHKNREPSVDGLLRECGNADGRVGSGPLAGSSLEDYIIGKQIGQGAYATVFFGLHRESGKKVAIKIYEKYKLLDPQRRKSVRCEIRLMERLRHPNIVIFHDALDTPKQIHIIMDFVGGGSLHHFLKKRPGRRLEDQVAKRLIFQVAQGIKYLHDRHIVHRDIKLENLLLDESNTVKIIDFGFSTIVPPGKKLKIFCGTPSYMAPEIVARKEYAGFCADIWAMGVLLYALLCGSFPFRGQNDRDLYRKIVRGVFHVPEVVTDGARNVLSRVLTPDMSRRPTIDDVLADQWFSSHRDDLYASAAKVPSTCYQPNTSTSSSCTTAAPSSSAGQSAREISRENTQPSMGNRAPSASRVSPAPGATGTTSTSNGNTSGMATNCVLDAWGNTTANSEEGNIQAGTGGTSESTDLGTRTQKLEEGSDRTDKADSRCSRQFEEEAISKLERLGYPREEIVRQLKDESSHLCKLYYRFLKALTAWDNKK